MQITYEKPPQLFINQGCRGVPLKGDVVPDGTIPHKFFPIFSKTFILPPDFRLLTGVIFL